MSRGAHIEEIEPGLWWWTTRHPEWHPGEFGAEVGSYLAVAGDELVLIDPQLPEETEAREAVTALIDRLAGGRRRTVALSVGYHTRSAEPLADRLGAEIRGPRQCASRLSDPARLVVPELGVPGPAGIEVLPLGKPVRGERALWLPSHQAIVFGDAVVVVPSGALRIWDIGEPSPERTTFVNDRFAPTLAPLADREPRLVLTTHGPPVRAAGAAAIRGAMAAGPWYRR